MRFLFYKPSLFARFDREAFQERLTRHLRRWGFAWLGVVLAAAILPTHYTLGLNATPSLPQRFFLTHKGERPQRGDFVAFRWHGGGPYPAGVTFIKIIAGMAGDTVTRVDREFFVDGVSVGKAKAMSRLGLPLELGPIGTIPAGHYYVSAPHPDSLDSRYRLTGWIADAQIIGRAYALF